VQRIAFRFIKGELVRFVSHLDLMRCFERAMRRADFPVGYTQGFNPRPRMAFASALSVGATSEWELGQVELAEPHDPACLEALIASLNAQLPSGLRIEEAWVVPLEKRSPFIQPTAAAYNLGLEGEAAGSLVEQFLRQGSGIPQATDWEIRPEGAGCWSLRLRLPIGEREGVRVRDVIARLEQELPGVKVTSLHRARLWCEAEPAR
jgi:radical SAM-linked protein